MFTVYIIQSDNAGKYYTGYTSDIYERLKHHNSGANRSTRSGRPWRVVYKEEFPDKKSAWFREHQIKSYKGGKAFRKLIQGGVA